MKSSAVAVFFAAIVVFPLLCSAEPLPEAERTLLLNRLVPAPDAVRLTDGPEVVLDASLELVVELAEKVNSVETGTKTRALFKQYFGSEPTVSFLIMETVSAEVPREKDAYKIRAVVKEGKSTLRISAADFAGVRYALSTLRQLAETNRGTEKTVDYRIPELEIEDAPAMAFRGVHVCWFPETSAFRIEQALRLAAYYKFNHFVVEFWGTYPYRSHPELCWQEFKTSPEEVKRLVKLGKELGVTMIPQFNLFGHAAAARESTGKHVTLDLHPKYLPQFEPDGWVWCLSNPAARKTITDVVLELYELFDRPPYFHVGCDEAYSPAQCRSCRRANYNELFREHLLYFHKLLAEKNCRMMMWHDMLIMGGDPRWKGYTAVGNKNTDGLLDKLPKDIVICDWQYGAGKKEGETWPSMRFFKEQGFTVLACPWENLQGIRSQGKTVSEAKLDGMLVTTWHHMHGGNMLRMFTGGANAAWSKPPYRDVSRHMFNMHLRQIGWDMPVEKYRDTGHVDWQVAPEKIMNDSLPGH